MGSGAIGLQARRRKKHRPQRPANQWLPGSARFPPHGRRKLVQRSLLEPRLTTLLFLRAERPARSIQLSAHGIAALPQRPAARPALLLPPASPLRQRTAAISYALLCARLPQRAQREPSSNRRDRDRRRRERLCPSSAPLVA